VSQSLGANPGVSAARERLVRRGLLLNIAKEGLEAVRGEEHCDDCR
jgi:hypothetical protein